MADSTTTSDLATIHENLECNQPVKSATFPCCYKDNGCFIRRNSSEIDIHQTHCMFQLITCPLNSSCIWSGNLISLEDHVEQSHREKFRKNPLKFEIDCEISNIQTYFTIIEDDVFVIVAEYNGSADVLKCAVLCTNNLYQYNLQLTSPSDDSQKVVRLNKNSIGFLYQQYDMCELDVGWIKSSFNTSDISCTFKIKTIDVAPGLNWDPNILVHFRCFLCMVYIISPIYMLTEYHSICQKCWEYAFRGENLEFSPCRNYALENVGASLYNSDEDVNIISNSSPKSGILSHLSHLMRGLFYVICCDIIFVIIIKVRAYILGPDVAA